MEPVKDAEIFEYVEEDIDEEINVEYTDEKLMKGEYFMQQKKVDISINIALRIRDFCNELALPLCEKLDCNNILNLIN